MGVLYTLEEAFKELNLNEARASAKDMTVEEVYNYMMAAFGSEKGLQDAFGGALRVKGDMTIKDAFLNLVRDISLDFDDDLSFSDICPESVIKKFNKHLKDHGKESIHRVGDDVANGYIIDKEKKVAEEGKHRREYFGDDCDSIEDFIKNATTNVRVLLPIKGKNNSIWMSKKIDKWNAMSGEDYQPGSANQEASSIEITLSKKAVEALAKNNPELYQELMDWEVEKIDLFGLPGEKIYTSKAVTKDANGYSINSVITAASLLDQGIIKLGRNN